MRGVLAKLMLFILMGMPFAVHAAELEVFAGIAPMAHVVERVGGRHVRLQILIGKGREPHTFEPTARQMIALSRADLYFIVGTLPFEQRLAARLGKVNQRLTVVDAGRGVAMRKTLEHPHGEGHHHNGEDPHIWMGPAQLKVMAKNVAEALTKAAPEHKANFEGNLRAYLEEADKTWARMRKALAAHADETVLAFHPAFGYFLDSCGLKQETVEVLGKRPSPRQLQAVIQEARTKNIQVVLVQPQFDAKSAETVASAIGATVLAIDPLKQDVLANLEEAASKIAKTLAEAAHGN